MEFSKKLEENDKIDYCPLKNQANGKPTAQSLAIKRQ